MWSVMQDRFDILYGMKTQAQLGENTYPSVLRHIMGSISTNIKTHTIDNAIGKEEHKDNAHGNYTTYCVHCYRLKQLSYC